MRAYLRRVVCWTLGHHPVGPPFYSPMCARCGLILHDVIYRCRKCGTLTVEEQDETATPTGEPRAGECKCWGSPDWQSGTWVPAGREGNE